MIICDLDNTLAPHFTKTPTAMAINFVNEAKEQGFVFVVVYNNTKKRVSEFCKKLNVDDFVYNAKKPFLRKTKKIIDAYFNYSNSHTIIEDIDNAKVFPKSINDVEDEPEQLSL